MALLKRLVQAGAPDKVGQEVAGRGYFDEEDEEKDEEDDRGHDAEDIDRPRGIPRAKYKRIALGEGVASTARSSCRARMQKVRLTDQ